MNAQIHNLPSVKSKKLIIFGAILIFIQFLLTIVICEKVPQYSGSKSSFKATMSLEQVKPDSETYWLFNPAGFAMANPNGFSKMAWFQVKPYSHNYYEWKEEPFWLQPIASMLGNELTNLLRLYKPMPQITIFETTPQLISIFNIEAPAPLSKSSFTIEGNISKRTLIYAPELPLFECSNVYPASVVYVVINNDGFVLSPILINESGFPPADSSAVELAKRFRFEPIKSDNKNVNPEFGKIIFNWRFVKPGQSQNITTEKSN